jgi:hypothetical protein
MTELEDRLIAWTLMQKDACDKMVDFLGVLKPRWNPPSDMEDETIDCFFLFQVREMDVYQTIDGSISYICLVWENGEKFFYSTFWVEGFEKLKEDHPSFMWVYYESMRRPIKKNREYILRGENHDN